MDNITNCSQDTDSLKLVREGTSQEQRFSPALDPAYAPIDERTVAHRVVFAQAYAAYLKYYNPSNAWEGDWQAFFNNDVSALLAVAAVQDVTYYRQQVKEYADFLSNRQNRLNIDGLRDHLDYLFSCCVTLAIRLDHLKENLPAEILLKQLLQNLVQSQLAPALKRLIEYHKGGAAFTSNWPVNRSDKEKAALETLGGNVSLKILGGDAAKFSQVSAASLSKDWTNGGDWATYYGIITGDDSVYGSGNTVFERVNHIATHNRFTSILDQFLKAYARTVKEASQALEKTFTKWDSHEPHYTLFLAFLRLFEFARTEINTLTGRHLDFYYREILRLKEKAPEPGHAHLLVELAKQVNSHEFKKGVLFKAGKDDLGKDAFFANDHDFVANQAKVMALKTVYVPKNGQNNTLPLQDNRLFASPVANSDDGMGAELTSIDKSWHPFHNKIYREGELSEIKMPKAEIGFAIASHYLLMAGGTRKVTVTFTVTTGLTEESNYKDDIVCLFTTEKGWFKKEASASKDEESFSFNADKDALTVTLIITLDGADPVIIPYTTKVHGYNFATNLPVLLVKLRNRDDVEDKYSKLQDVVVKRIDLTVNVTGLKTLAVSNDFGPVDTSKPFQPFGASPVANSALIIGSKEIFQKKLDSASVNVTWQSAPAPFNKTVNVTIDYLLAGKWESSDITPLDVKNSSFSLLDASKKLYIDAPDLLAPEHYSVSSRHGFVRLKLDGDFGQNGYEQALIDYIKKVVDKTLTDKDTKPLPPIGPFVTELTLDYTATQQITLDDADKSKFEDRLSRFYHLTPFGHAEQHPFLNSANKAFLLPQFSFQRDGAANTSEAEFYIGLTGLKLPQNLALLFQVADGTADPLSKKPDPHIHWSYLCGNEWIPFAKDEVDDKTDGLLNSGIITFVMPLDASDTNTLLPAGMHWIRASVASGSDAVCRLRLVAAQALKATFADKGNDPAFPAKALESGNISKLDQPDAAVKTITQPFVTFGGRGKEDSKAFYTRVSERLRHKDRGIALWDYERLILEAFPQIYKAKCLNHMEYGPDENGNVSYRELAPGHVTVVTIPDQQFHNLRDPFRPYTSLGLLEEIGAFLSKRLSCFVTLHVSNPEFEDIWVKCNVRLKDGFDETFSVNKLQEAITRFLSPWAFPGGGSPSFGGKIYKSVLINFVEDLPYVDYVTDFQLLHTFNGFNGSPQTVEKNEVEGYRAVSILVSARRHDITTINPAVAETPGEKCPCEAT